MPIGPRRWTRSRSSALAAVNDYFERRLVVVPGIRDYLTSMGAHLS